MDYEAKIAKYAVSACREKSEIECREFVPSLHMAITDHCYNKCSMCGHWRRKEKSHMSAKTFHNIIDDPLVANKLETICFTGGEPFANPDFEGFLKACVQREIDFGIVTSGLFWHRFLVDRSLLEKARFISISFDAGDEETYKQIRGGEGKLENVIQMIRELGQSIPIRITTTLTKVNLLKLYKTLRHLLQFSVEGLVDRVDLRVAYRHALDGWTKEDTTFVKDMAEAIEPQFDFDGVEFNLDVRERLLPFSHCYAVEYQLFVDPNGSFHPCCLMGGDTEIKDKGSSFGVDPLYAYYNREAWKNTKAEDLPELCRVDCPGRLNKINHSVEEIMKSKNFY